MQPGEAVDFHPSGVVLEPECIPVLIPAHPGTSLRPESKVTENGH